MLAAMSTCDMIQPPKMSPAKLVSVGMAKTRSVGSRSCGRHELIIRRFLALVALVLPGVVSFVMREDARAARLQGWREQDVLDGTGRQAERDAPQLRILL